MPPARRWYERLLGGALIFIGACFLLPVSAVWIWAQHEYTVGLSIDPAAVPKLAAFFLVVSVVIGILALLGGIALWKKRET